MLTKKHGMEYEEAAYEQFCGLGSMRDYLEECLEVTVLSNEKATHYIHGNACGLLDADVLLDVCYVTLFTLCNHVNSSAFMKYDDLKEDIDHLAVGFFGN